MNRTKILEEAVYKCYNPTNNKQDVIDYWKSKDVDMEIKEYNPYEDE